MSQQDIGIETLASAFPKIQSNFDELYGDVVNVKWFGAKGDGITDDLAAFNLATAHAISIGTKIFIPDGYYRLTGSWHIGEEVYSQYDFMVNRTGSTLDTDFNTYQDSQVKINNRDNYEAIDIEFSRGAYLLADWLPTNPEPVLAYHLKTDRDKGRRATISGAQIISAEVFANGEHAPISTSVPVTNNLIGLYYDNKVSLVENTAIGGIGYGIVEVNPFWCELTTAKINQAKECINSLQGNAHRINNIEMWRSSKGLIFNGSASSVTDIHTENVAEDIIIFSGDANVFGPMYLEDANSADGTGTYAVTLGMTAESYDVLHSTFQGIRVGAMRPNKGAFRIYGTVKAAFIATRTYSSSIIVDNLSTGTLIECDFTVNDKFQTKTDLVTKSGTTILDQVATYHDNGVVKGTELLKYDQTTLRIGGTVIEQGVATPTRTASQYQIKTNAPRTQNNYMGMIGAGESDIQVNAGMFAFDDGGGAALGLSFWTGSSGGISEALKIDSNQNITAKSLRLSSLNAAPASATDTGTAGEIRITATYIYVCTATNTWVRTALTTW